MKRLQLGVGVFASILVPAWIGCNPAPSPPSMVLHAEVSMVIGADSNVSGDVEVRQIEPLPATTTAVESPDAVVGSPQLIVRKNAHVGTDASCAAIGLVVANSISANGSACLGATLTSQLTGNPTVASVNPFPLVTLAPLPLAPLPATGADVDVKQNAQTTLSPGNYGDVVIRKSGTLVLQPGAYSFASVDARDGSKLTTSAGGVTVVTQSLTAHQSVSIAPASGFVASDLEVTVAGDASIGQSSSVTALIAAPHGALTLADDVTATGSFAAFSIELKQRVTVTYQSGFAASPHGSQQLTGYTEIDADGSFGAIAPLERDKVFSISLGLPFPNAAAVEAFVNDISNPKSVNYRNYLTPLQFKQQFSPTDADYAQVVRWVSAHGLTVQHTFSNNLAVTASGTADQFERALHVNLFYRVGGGHAPGFIAVDREPSLDLEPSLLWISGFTDSVVAQSKVCPQNQILAPPAHRPTTAPALGAADLRQAYLEDHQITDTISCLGLAGEGETIGILSLERTTVSDRDFYFAQQPWILPSDIAPTVAPINISDPGELKSDDGEASLDVEMASAMAPRATVQVFQGPDGVSGHVTDLVNAMATFTPVLSSVSNSYGFGYDANTSQTLAEFAAQGTSYFNASGDWGDISDPNNDIDFEFQTLVGGTALNVNQATVSGTIASFSTPYYFSEATWNGGCAGVIPIGDNTQELELSSSKDITGGGILNGVRQASTCYASTCQHGSNIPFYQTAYFAAFPPSAFVRLPTNPDFADPTRGSGASLVFRNYPDVSAAATNLTTWESAGSTTPPTPQFGFGSGTSASAPLWAGYTALINQALKQSGLRRVGFANPALYAIAASAADRLGNNILFGAFHDIDDGLFNQEPQPNMFGWDNTNLGYPAVDGYDLATGLGTPTCHLLNLLASPFPLNPPTVVPTFGFVFGEIAVGNDDLDAQSGATLNIQTISKTYSCPLKPTNTLTGWDPGTVWPIQCPLVPPVAVSDVVSVSVVLDENGQDGLSADNWDVTGLHVRLGNFDTQNPNFACLVNESSDDACDIDQPSCNPSTGKLGDTNDHGVFRLSENSGSGGQGPNAFFTPAIEQARFQQSTLFPSNIAPQGCPAFNPSIPYQPSHSVHIVLDTGNDGMNAGSSAIVQINTQNNSIGNINIPLPAIPISDRSEVGVDFDFTADTPAKQIANITITFAPSGNDEWHLFGLSAFANGLTPSGQDFCLVRVSSSDFVFNTSHKTQSFAVTVGECP